MHTARSWHQGGVVTYPDGTKGILAAGGVDLKSSEFLNLETMVWEPKKDLPMVVRSGRSVPYKEGFLIVSGMSNDKIYYFNPAEDDWELLPQTVKDGASYLDTYLVPSTFEDCL